ncbi:Palmitoyltransferase SWF1, partial [Dissostichus eleginoides]
MKRKRADIASFFNKKNPAEAQENERQGQMEKGQTDRERGRGVSSETWPKWTSRPVQAQLTDSESERDEPPRTSGPSGPP